MFAFGSWQGTAGSQRLELTVANVGTTGYHCKELPVPRGWNAWFPTWESEVTIASNCRFPPGNHRLPLQRTSKFLKVGTDGSQRGNQRLPWQGTAGSQTLKPRVPNLEVTIARNCRFPEVRTYFFEAKRLSL